MLKLKNEGNKVTGNIMKTKMVLMLAAVVLFGFTFGSCKACKDKKNGGHHVNRGAILNSSSSNSNTQTSPNSTLATIE